MVVVGGNHDSAARLDAPAEILGALKIHVVGGLPNLEDPAGFARVLIPLYDRDQRVQARILAVPFLRRRDLPLPDDPASVASMNPAHRALVEGHRALYRRLVKAAKRHMAPNEALLATGHCYMAEGQISELSERKIQVGYQHALPVDIFPRELAYVALGHLHRAQPVGDQARVRYSGSPIPLSLAERHYEHQVLRVDFEGPRLKAVTPLFVPRTIDVLFVPEEHQPLKRVIPLLLALPRQKPTHASEADRPFLEVRVTLDETHPRLRQDIQDALVGAWPRLVRIDARRPEAVTPAPLAPSVRNLDDIAPADVFRAAYAQHRGHAPSDRLMGLFFELLEDVYREST